MEEPKISFIYLQLIPIETWLRHMWPLHLTVMINSIKKEPVMMDHTCNSSILEAETGGIRV